MSTEQTPSPSRLQPLRDFLAQHNRFLLLTHIGPDGDGLLASVALSRYLREIGKHATVVTEDKAPVFVASFDPEGLVRSRGDLLAQEDWAERFDACLILDTGKASRLGRLEEPLMASGLPLAVVDHHIREEDNIDCPSVIDPDAAAVGEMIADYLDEEGYPFDDPLITRALMACLVYDTGQFRFTNTSKRTLNWAARLVELGASPGEAYSIFWESNGAGSIKLLGELMSRMTLDCGGRLAWFTLSDEGVGALRGFALGDGGIHFDSPLDRVRRGHRLFLRTRKRTNPREPALEGPSGDSRRGADVRRRRPCLRRRRAHAAPAR